MDMVLDHLAGDRGVRGRCEQGEAEQRRDDGRDLLLAGSEAAQHLHDAVGVVDDETASM